MTISDGYMMKYNFKHKIIIAKFQPFFHFLDFKEGY